MRVAVTVEANAVSRTRCAARATNDSNESSTTTGTNSTTTNSGGRPKKYMGKEINEYGF